MDTPKTLAEVEAHPAVDSVERRVEGQLWWIYLKAGWTASNDPHGTHQGNGHTLQEAIDDVWPIQRCQCPDCENPPELPTPLVDHTVYVGMVTVWRDDGETSHCPRALVTIDLGGKTATGEELLSWYVNTYSVADRRGLYITRAPRHVEYI